MDDIIRWGVVVVQGGSDLCIKIICTTFGAVRLELIYRE
jgi:hypothetical protein